MSFESCNEKRMHEGLATNALSIAPLSLRARWYYVACLRLGRLYAKIPRSILSLGLSHGDIGQGRFFSSSNIIVTNSCMLLQT